MPGVYKEKSCPNCGTKHRKKGPFCSQGCSNSHRDVSDNVRKNMRKVAQDYNLTPEAIAQQKLIGVPSEDFAIEIPEFKPDISEIDLFDGYDRGENW